MNSTTQCSDLRLRHLIEGDESNPEYQSSLQHVDSCASCQTRLEQLAADSGVWQEARDVLTSADGVEHAGSDSPANRWRHPNWQRRPVAWNKTMARHLLFPPSHPEMLGRIGRYDVERLIGSGGMGVVFKAWDTELNRPVAVKLLAPYLAENGSARKRFAREARAAAAVLDEHVVAIHNVESGDDPQQPPFLVMKYIAGGSLQQRLDRDGPLEVCEILRIGMQTARGLAAAHAQGLIHRDVKPSNILLDEGVERALLTDFGLARAEDDACLTRSGFHPGTPHYMSPEQVRGEPIDGRSDLFSLGCVFYALCTGHPPFRAETSYAVLRRITDDTARPIRELNPNIPEWLERIFMKLLSKSREDRFDSADQVAELLEDCLAHVQHPATAPFPEAIAGLVPRRRHPSYKQFALAAILAFPLFIAGVLIVLELNKGTLTIVSEIDGVPIRILKGDKVIEQLMVHQSGEAVRIAAGNYVVMIDGPTDEITVRDGQVSLRRGENEIVKIVRAQVLSDASVALPLHGVPFELGESQFEDKDHVEIQSITSSGNGFELGATVTVSGVYTLESVDSADLCFFSTISLRAEEKPTATHTLPTQRIKAMRGTHAFELSNVIRDKGSPHITFYHLMTGKPIGGIYFSVTTEAVFDNLGHSHPVRLGSPERKDVTLSEAYVCRIESHRHLIVRASTTGYLDTIRIKEGQAVAQGDLLFRIIPAADTEELASDNAISIAAPFAGVVGSAHVPKGTPVQKGDALTTLADSSQMSVFFNVPEARYLDYTAAKLSEHLDDLEIELMLSDRSKFNQQSKLASMGSEFNPQTGSITFRADFPNPDHLLRHGMTGTVTLHRVQHNAIVIPQSATFEVLNKRYVYVIDKNNAAQRRQIEIQSELDDTFVVKSGVDVDDEIVVDGIRPLMDTDQAESDDREQAHPNAEELPTPSLAPHR